MILIHIEKMGTSEPEALFRYIPIE